MCKYDRHLQPNRKVTSKDIDIDKIIELKLYAKELNERLRAYKKSEVSIYK